MLCAASLNGRGPNLGIFTLSYVSDVEMDNPVFGVNSVGGDLRSVIAVSIGSKSRPRKFLKLYTKDPYDEASARVYEKKDHNLISQPPKARFPWRMRL
ncbi:hypothetical protein GJ744_003162 [Endocarpon pusillum]|uniref:Uncharacterized protein n=1 Tax=Endocarpon pusillum TaxID=364733 RepID=A0A8H7E661_9EURO|nr:hypothetical protein GJ744_003162 [Endocarpon pusillum]